LVRVVGNIDVVYAVAALSGSIREFEHIKRKSRNYYLHFLRSGDEKMTTKVVVTGNSIPQQLLLFLVLSAFSRHLIHGAGLAAGNIC
jgi:hypothetical protein